MIIRSAVQCHLCRYLNLPEGLRLGQPEHGTALGVQECKYFDIIGNARHKFFRQSLISKNSYTSSKNPLRRSGCSRKDRPGPLAISSG